MLNLVKKINISYLSTTKNYANSFKIRSKLADFFKHVHPDQMQQAPTKIKQQNLKSLKNFNSYIDSINQQKSIQGKLLKFYIAEKTNLKSKKFFSFTIELPQITNQNSQMNAQKAEKLMDNIVNVLNKKFKESREMGNPKSKKQQIRQQSLMNQSIKIETEEERIQRSQQTISPFQKNTVYRDQLMEKQLKNTISSKYRQAEKDRLMSQLRKKVSFADTASNKPMMWSRLIMQESGIYSDYQKILAELIDPKLIYFNQQLTDEQIELFKKKLLPGDLNIQLFKQTQKIIQVCKQMEATSPPLCFYVTKHYSGTEIPGFFSIPYNFTGETLLKQFNNLKAQIIEERDKYQQFYDYYLQLLGQLKKKNNMIVKLQEFTNSDDIWMKILMLKRLQRYQVPQLTQIIALDQEGYTIFKDNYKINTEKTVEFFKQKIILTINFQDIDFQETIATINKRL